MLVSSRPGSSQSKGLVKGLFVVAGSALVAYVSIRLIDPLMQAPFVGKWTQDSGPEADMTWLLDKGPLGYPQVTGVTLTIGPGSIKGNGSLTFTVVSPGRDTRQVSAKRTTVLLHWRIGAGRFRGPHFWLDTISGTDVTKQARVRSRMSWDYEVTDDGQTMTLSDRSTTIELRRRGARQ